MIVKFEKSFSAAHFYRQPQWSDQQNQQEFGLCFHPHGHGHDYTLEIEIFCDERNRQLAFQEFQTLVSRLDHQHLNFLLPEFQSKVPTTENLALFLQRELVEKLEPSQIRLMSLKLKETPEIWVELKSSQN